MARVAIDGLPVLAGVGPESVAGGGVAADQAAHHLAALVASCADGIIGTSPDGVIRTWNQAAAAMFGYAAAAVVGADAALLFNSAHGEAVSAALKQAQGRVAAASSNPTGAVPLEVVGCCKDGSLIFVRLTITPVLAAAAGAVEGFFLVARDVTEQKFLEEEFRHAQKMEPLGRLAGSIAHDFNNLLMGITGCCSMALSRMQQESAARGFVEEIQAAAHRGVNLSRQLVSFGRKGPVELRRVAIDAVVRTAAPMLQQLLGEQMTLCIEASSHGAPVYADPGHLEQVLMNLVVNARDAMAGAGEICIRTSEVRVAPSVTPAMRGLAPGAPQHLPPGHYVVLSVSDQGCGIERDILMKIFDPFFTTKPPGEGTGLGLSTVGGIVRQLGGYVDVHTTVGEGSTFSCYFPYGEVECTPEAPPSGEAAVLSGCETILVVEDERLVRLTVDHYLTGLGYRIFSASEPLEALRLCREHAGAIHLILIDVLLPGTGGACLAGQLQKEQRQARVLFMSANSREGLLSQGRLQAQDVLIEKPFCKPFLAAAIRQVLDGASVGAAGQG